MRHVIAPSGCAGGADGRRGDIMINPDRADAKRLPTRYADYPLKAGDMFRLDTPGGGGFGDPRERAADAVLADVCEGYVSVAAAARDYVVVVIETEQGFEVDAAATKCWRTEVKGKD
jgi:N-methylhydantoinase B